MTFISIPFFILFSVTLILVSRIKGNENRIRVLLLASYIFYAWWDVRFLGLLILQTYISWYLAKQIKKTRITDDNGCISEASIHKSKWLCAIGVIFSLAILGIFKYYNFFGETICRVIGKDSSELWHIVLPVGISFYTFQSMSYLIVLRKVASIR